MDVSYRSLTMAVIATGLAGQANAGLFRTPSASLTFCLNDAADKEKIMDVLQSDVGIVDDGTRFEFGKSADGKDTIDIIVEGAIGHDIYQEELEMAEQGRGELFEKIVPYLEGDSGKNIGKVSGKSSPKTTCGAALTS